MIRKGFTIENPQTKSRTTVMESDIETNGNGWMLEVQSIPHAGPDILEHLHLTWTETFEIISGNAYYKVNGLKGTIAAGDSFTVRPKEPHVHPWNAGETRMVYRQRNTFAVPDATAVQEVLGVFATRADLAREGKVDAQGRPKNILQLAVTLKTLTKHGSYDAKLPILLQKFLAATLGTIGELLGYEAIRSQDRSNR